MCGKQEKPARTWRTWVGSFVGLMIISTAGRMYGDWKDSRATPPAAAVRTITAVSTRQSSEGVTAAQMDQAFLDRLGQYLEARSNQDGPHAYQHEGVYLEIGGRKLAVVRLRTQGVTPIAYIAAVQDGELVRVGCVSNVLANVPVTSGPCADKIKEAFGVGLTGATTVATIVPAAPYPTQPPIASGSSAFVRKHFGDIAIELPANWLWMEQSDAASLNTNSEALARSLGAEVNQGSNAVLAAGNAFNDAKESVATVRLSVRSGTKGGQADMREGLKEPQREVEAMMLIGLEKTAAAMRKHPGMKFYRVRGGGLRQNASLVCTWSGFVYDAGRGAMVSDSWVCPVGNRTVKLTTSYQEERASLFAATVDYMWRSLSVASAR